MTAEDDAAQLHARYRYRQLQGCRLHLSALVVLKSFSLPYRADGMESGARRTPEQVEEVAKAAGLTGTCGPTQLLHFGPRLNTEEVKLLELPEDVLGALRSGQR